MECSECLKIGEDLEIKKGMPIEWHTFLSFSEQLE